MKQSMPDDFIDRVRSQADIVSVVSEYVSLKKRGRDHWGCCPFHQEKSASFSVSPDKGFFYCFGCQAGGDVYRFLMRIEGLSFGDAVKRLAGKMGIALPERERSEAEIRAEREREDVLRANALAKDFYQACLRKSAYGKPGLAYLEKRGLTSDCIESFALGFAPDAWDKMSVALQGKGVSSDVLIRAGLSLPRPQSGVYDRFRNRIMFPIEDIRGRVIGFGGRVMDGGEPKYLNSSETMVFRKKQVLYGIQRAYRHIKDAGRSIVVEGYMDVLALVGQGIPNVVASLGTAFTPEQARMLNHYAPEIYFAYDSDAAGQNATLKALSLIRSGGSVVKVVKLPQGKDPDEFIRKAGVEAFKKQIDGAAGLLEFQIDWVLSTVKYDDLSGKAEVVRQAIPFLSGVDNEIEQGRQLARLAEKLGIDENSIRSELRKVKRGQSQNPALAKTMLRKPDARVVKAEIGLLANLLKDAELFSSIASFLSPDDFREENRRVIAEILWEEYTAGRTVSVEKLTDRLEEPAVQELSRLVMAEVPTADAQAMDDYARSILKARLNDEYEYHRLRADEMMRNGDSEYVQELTEARRILTKINEFFKSQ